MNLVDKALKAVVWAEKVLIMDGPFIQLRVERALPVTNNKKTT